MHRFLLCRRCPRALARILFSRRNVFTLYITKTESHYSFFVKRMFNNISYTNVHLDHRVKRSITRVGAASRRSLGTCAKCLLIKSILLSHERSKKGLFSRERNPRRMTAHRTPTVALLDATLVGFARALEPRPRNEIIKNNLSSWVRARRAMATSSVPRTRRRLETNRRRIRTREASVEGAKRRGARSLATVSATASDG